MDFVSQRHLLHVPQALSPYFQPPYETGNPPHTSTPIVAILIIGMTVTSFFLLGYYIFVIKCCLNLQHRVDHTRRLSIVRQGEYPSYSTASEPRGLEEAVIRLIPVIHYTPEEGVREFGERSFSCECAICLNEFQEDEKLRVIPNCSHVFHIDCIDVWLQNNVHCPLCRRNVSLTSHVVNVDQLITPRPSPQDQSQNIESLIGVDEGFVVIDLDSEDGRGQNLEARQEELPTRSIGLSSQSKKERKFQKVTSMGDECVGDRAKDERFLVQPMRRSFSMDSSVNRQFYGAIQHQNGHVHEVSTIETCVGGSGRVKRSCFSFGHGRRSISAVLPVYLDP
ncbi:RING-H2 finger protein ATL1-like [Abrus precatorius]|uniref:RING-type E3 ubiquitin transferase n=1 Tax=Abrus precatorius TaxID=3816 RepID=A0A8B8M6V7_ABRPR|nr:RING-H2 finger protein ATL1-like [Abrus precatorius]